jgi:hypothetical protein
VVKLAMAFLADPKQVIYRLIENALIRQMGTFDPIRTPAYFAFALSPQLYGASQSPPAWRLKVTLIFTLLFRRGLLCRCGSDRSDW